MEGSCKGLHGSLATLNDKLAQYLDQCGLAANNTTKSTAIHKACEVINNYEDEIASLRTICATLRGENSTLQRTQKDQQCKLNELQEKYKSTQKQNQDITRELKLCDAKVSDLEKILSLSVTQQAILESENSVLLRELEERDNKLNTLDKSYQDLLGRTELLTAHNEQLDKKIEFQRAVHRQWFSGEELPDSNLTSLQGEDFAWLQQAVKDFRERPKASQCKSEQLLLSSLSDVRDTLKHLDELPLEDSLYLECQTAQETLSTVTEEMTILAQDHRDVQQEVIIYQQLMQLEQKRIDSITESSPRSSYPPCSLLCLETENQQTIKNSLNVLNGSIFMLIFLFLYMWKTDEV